jgi:site-specific recombinase
VPNWEPLRQRLTRLGRRPALDALLAHADPEQSLADRVAWAEDLLDWMRRRSPEKRLRLLLQILDRQPEARLRVAQTFRSLVSDTCALDLFADTGLPRRVAFSHEAVARLTARVLPDPPAARDLGDVFDRLFSRAYDGDWLERIDAGLAQQIVQLFHHGETAEDSGWNSLRSDLEDALVQLAGRIRVTGSGREVRSRLARSTFRELPFQRLAPAVENLLNHSRNGVAQKELIAELNLVRAAADACNQAVDEVTGRLTQTGVNTSLVYDLERIRVQVRRLELLLEVWATPRLDDARLIAVLAELVRSNHEQRSLPALLRQNLHLLTRRIVERNAETGEHYVARSRAEYFGMLRRALGGGALTGFTTLIKLFSAKLALAHFFKGAAFSLNYAGSFVAIQLAGFTLATKQPATTAPALARRMEELRDTARLEALVDEIVCLIRSQTAAIAGNLLAVIPATFLLHWAWTASVGHSLIDETKARAIVDSVSALSGAWPYAIFTGVLLWFSSILAAWADNWFTLHELRAALAGHRGLQHFLGPSRATRLALWFERNIAGLAGNISLGLMLGMIPEVASFFGAPIDVRHVTLSTGQFTAALSVLGVGALGWKVWLFSVVGILGIGVFNVLISFMLALFVAMRARNVRAPERGLLYRAVVRRFFGEPLSFIFPVGRAVTKESSGH